MTYVVKVAKRGFDVTDIGKSGTTTYSSTFLPHLLYALAFVYLVGAKKQVIRYQTATSALNINTISSTYDCLHEASTLFEDLATISKYAEKCGHTNTFHKLLFDVRNHIRHDIREEFDNENSKLKNERAKRLKLNHRLQTDISFTKESIKVGEVIIEIKEINSYLSWAEEIMKNIIIEAKKKGLIKVE